MTGRHNSIMIMFQAGQPWNQSYFQHVKVIFFLSKASRAHPASWVMCSVSLSLGIKQPGHEPHHSPPCTACYCIQKAMTDGSHMVLYVIFCEIQELCVNLKKQWNIMDTALHWVQRLSKICRNQKCVTGKSGNTTEMVKSLNTEFQVTACGQCSPTVLDFALHPQKL